ncbi:efflux RND transporter periplasmic adaptor subunit [Caballeronia arationis]|nr:efflux RND transporter periplasmic adaptor subunit [Caballeronia arationis]
MATIKTIATVAVTGAALVAACFVSGCKKPPATPERAPADVTVLTVSAHDTPVTFEFVAQTQSSREVEIRARVEGFLDKRLYVEGSLVHAGQTLFQMDRRPFEAALQTAKGQLAQQQARLTVTKANLARVRPLVEQNAVSKKDLDDAVGNEKEAEAAVIAAQGQVQTAQLNLSYTTITTPLTGLSSYARKQEGSYVTPGESGLLTYVAQLDPIWVNFSLSENEVLRYRDQETKGQLKFPGDRDFEVEVVLADGSVFPKRGRINFLDPSYSKETGTFLVRAVLPNAQGILRPGQFVRARVYGATRPNAILVPQRAVLQGARSHYVWLVDKDGKAAKEQVVEVGDWYGDNWFVTAGLRAGDRVVVDGAIRVAQGLPIKVTGDAALAPPASDAIARPSGATGTGTGTGSAAGASAGSGTAAK